MNKWRGRREERFICCRISRFLVSRASFFSSLLNPHFAISVLMNTFSWEGVKTGVIYSGKHSSQFSLLACLCKGFWWKGTHFSGKQVRRTWFFVWETVLPSFQGCWCRPPDEASTEAGGCQCCLENDGLRLFSLGMASSAPNTSPELGLEPPPVLTC